MKYQIGQYIRMAEKNNNKYPSNKWFLITGKDHDSYIVLDENGAKLINSEKYWNVPKEYHGKSMSKEIVCINDIIDVIKCLKCQKEKANKYEISL